MKLKNSFKGFTLVEVLIVIIIVGILIAALLPRLQGTQARARDTARTGHVNQISQAAALALADTPNAAVTGCADVAYTAALSGYLNSLPTDPQGTAGPQTTNSCDGANYFIGFGAGQYYAVGELENTNGNCNVAAPTSILTNGGGDSFCVIIQ